jgi:hypothetical protein
MTQEEMQAAANEAAAALAQAAGVAELAAAAEVETDGADALRAALLAHELAADHRLAMRFAAAGNSVLDAAIAADTPAGAAAANLAAARLGNSAARCMTRFRQGLAALARCPRAAETSLPWVAYSFAGEPLCSPEEQARRLAEAKAERLRCQGPEEASADSRPGTPEEQARVGAARTAADAMLAEAAVPALAAAAASDAGLLPRLFAHQLAASHRLMMRFSGRADAALDGGDAIAHTDALRLAATATHLLGHFRQGLLARSTLVPGPEGGPGRPIAGYYYVGTTLDLHATGYANDPGATDAGAAPAAVERSNRGRLKYGNPSGDYMRAPRCGARTRAGCACRQPAMRNGRCRFHGGKSTGPRTAAGLAASRAARRTHGGYSAEIVDLRKESAARARRLRALFGQRTDVGGQKAPAPDAVTMPPVLVLPAGTFCPPSSVLRHPAFAGHGVDPSKSSTAAGRGGPDRASNRWSPLSHASGRGLG